MNFQNRTLFENDNLPILRALDADTVALIYLDPPFNSNRNYAAPIGSEAAGAAFKDTWTLSDVNEAEHGELADREPALYAAIHAAGLTHGKSMKSYLIMMGLRMLEMRRVLKETGSIYLHCDPNASHYLKLLMDAVFGKDNFRNEITWKRQSGHSDSKGFGRITDIILFYGTPIRKDAVRVPLSGKRAASYNRKDAAGWYAVGDLSAKGLSGGGYTYEFHGHHGPWRYPEKRIRELEAAGRVYIPKKHNGVPRLKRYLHENKGVVPNSIWTDIPPVQSHAKERLGYPTQKPIKLLERIIQASSNQGDVVLDPFCGCATTCIAAEKLGRQWVGIDISSRAVELVRYRLERELGLDEREGILGTVIHRTDIPRPSERLPNYRTHKHTLYGQQEGVCNGCRTHFPFRNMTVDHIVAQSQGGSDHLENLQLLCNFCNSVKGTNSQAHLITRLQEMEI